MVTNRMIHLNILMSSWIAWGCGTEVVIATVSYASLVSVHSLCAVIIVGPGILRETEAFFISILASHKHTQHGVMWMNGRGWIQIISELIDVMQLIQSRLYHNDCRNTQINYIRLVIWYHIWWCQQCTFVVIVSHALISWFFFTNIDIRNGH